MAQLWTRVHGKEIPGRPRHLLPYRAEEGLRRLSLLLGGNQSLPCQHSQTQPHIDTDRDQTPNNLECFFFNLALTCAVMLNGYDADMSSSVETVQCEVQAAHPHASSHWREAVHLQGEYLLELECPSFIANKWQCYAWRLSNGFRGAAPHVGLSIEIWPQGFSCNLNAPPNELISVAKVTFSNQLLTLPSSPSP